jgi:hypothetical protein
VSRRIPGSPDPGAIPATAAERVLARASELDGAWVSVTDLRAAAREAGISAPAFEAALAEVTKAGQLRTTNAWRQTRRRWSPWLLTAAGAGLIAAGGWAVSGRALVSADAIVDEALAVHCLSAGHAIQLIRSHETLANSVELRIGARSDVVMVRAKPARLKQVKALLSSVRCAPGQTGVVR